MNHIIKTLIVLAFTLLASNNYACTKCNSKKKGTKKTTNHIWSKELSSLSEDKKEISELFTWLESKLSDHQIEIENHEKLNSSYARKVKYKSKNTLEIKRMRLEIGRKNEELSSGHMHFLKDHKRLMSVIKKLKELQKEYKSHEGHNH